MKINFNVKVFMQLLVTIFALISLPISSFAKKAPKIKIKGDWFYINGERFLVKGVGYSNYRPKEQPNTKKIDLDQVRYEFKIIREAGFNTIRTWTPLSLEELKLAHEAGLFVIQGMWIEYRENYADPARVKEIVDRLKPIIKESQQARNVLLYLVGNEPQPAQVFSVGRKKTDKFFQMLRKSISKSSPKAKVAISNWVQCDFLNDSMWDIAALNIYNYNPDSVSHSLGYRGYVSWLKNERAQKRPLIITEFGLSVSKGGLGKMEYGGNSLEEQEIGVLQMYEDAIDAGASGACVFEWIDEWWKNFNHPSDEKVHEPSDAEEWFGICYYEDGELKKRPVFESLKKFNQAIIISPKTRETVKSKIKIKMYVEKSIESVEAKLQGTEETIKLKRKSDHWFTGKLAISKDLTDIQTIEITSKAANQTYISTREVFIQNPNHNLPYKVEIILDEDVYYTQNKMTPVRLRFKVTDSKNKPLANQNINVAIYEPVINQKLKLEKKTDKEGIATHVYHVNEEGILTVSAGVVSFPDHVQNPVGKIHPSFIDRNGDCKHIKIFYSKN